MANICVFCGKKISGFSQSQRFYESYYFGKKIDCDLDYVNCAACQPKKDKMCEGLRFKDLDTAKTASEELMKRGGNKEDIRKAIDFIFHEFEKLEEAKEPEKTPEEVDNEITRKLEEQIQAMRAIRDIAFTTEDLHCKYKIVSPVFFNTTNKGVFSSAYSKLCSKYATEPYKTLVVKPKTKSLASGEFGTFFLSLFDAGLSYEGAVGQSNFDNAFYVAVAEMKLRAAEMGADAVIGVKMDFDLDTTNFGAFYLQMYGTAVKILEEE